MGKVEINVTRSWPEFRRHLERKTKAELVSIVMDETRYIERWHPALLEIAHTPPGSHTPEIAKRALGIGDEGAE